MKKEVQLVLASSPFLKSGEDTAFIMRQVIYSLVPVVLAAAYFFGIGAFLTILACLFGAMLPEYLGGKRWSTLKDGSAVITGILLGLTLPPTMPLWMAFLGGSVAIVLGKLIFGGLGHNVFNPALVGRAFLQAAFPTAITTWASPVNAGSFWSVPKSLFALPFCKADYSSTIAFSFTDYNAVDAVTTATPLGKMKFEFASTAYRDLFLGQVAGSLGETCALVILLGGIYLLLRNCLNWRIPASIFLSVIALSVVLHLSNARYPTPWFQLFSGGLMLGAVYMATDMVTSPVTNLGCWIFGAGVGILVVVIRLFGGLPEGVMYAILLMNSVTPLINGATQPKIYGAVSKQAH